MVKEKLKKYRLEKGFSHKDLAEVLCLSPTNYTRRENGETKISNEEWRKLSEKLETPLEDIYEAEENMTFIYRDQSSGNSGNHFYSIPQYMMDFQKKYIEKLEQEIVELKNTIENLKK